MLKVSRNMLPWQLDSSERKGRQSAVRSQRFWSGTQPGKPSHTSSPSSHCSRAGGKKMRSRENWRNMKEGEHVVWPVTAIHTFLGAYDERDFQIWCRFNLIPLMTIIRTLFLSCTVGSRSLTPQLCYITANLERIGKSENLERRRSDMYNEEGMFRILHHF